MPKLQEKPSALKREHPALQNVKILYFFLFLWVIFALLDPDPAAQINADPCGSGSGSGSETLHPGYRLKKALDAGFVSATKNCSIFKPKNLYRV
jgi:hypothetical protein